MESLNNKVQNRSTKCLIFDVETNGLLPRNNNNQEPIPISQYPFILQLSFVIYDTSICQIIKTYDSYIKVPDNIEITEYITKLTGISHALCKEKGNSIIEVIKIFYDAYIECGHLIAHNIDFDKKMIQVEIERNFDEVNRKIPDISRLFNPIYEKINNIQLYCTMMKGNNICNLWLDPVYDTDGKIIKKSKRKWPKLEELYMKLFDGEKPENLHNSMIDVLACLKCYLKMRNNVDNKNYI